MCIHLDMEENSNVEAFLSFKKSNYTDKFETKIIVERIQKMLMDDEKSDNPVTYRHKYEKGDFIMSDNLANLHHTEYDYLPELVVIPKEPKDKDKKEEKFDINQEQMS